MGFESPTRSVRFRPWSVGTRLPSGLVGELGVPATPSRWRSRVQVPSGPLEHTRARMRASPSGLGPLASTQMTRVQIPPFAPPSTPDEPVGAKRGIPPRRVRTHGESIRKLAPDAVSKTVREQSLVGSTPTLAATSPDELAAAASETDPSVATSQRPSAGTGRQHGVRRRGPPGVRVRPPGRAPRTTTRLVDASTPITCRSEVRFLGCAPCPEGQLIRRWGCWHSLPGCYPDARKGTVVRFHPSERCGGCRSMP